MEKGIEEEEDNLYKQTDDVAENVLERLDKPNKFNPTKTYKSEKANYSFQMNVYCQNLNEKELDNIFNYINKRFGTEY